MTGAAIVATLTGQRVSTRDIINTQLIELTGCGLTASIDTVCSPWSTATTYTKHLGVVTDIGSTERGVTHSTQAKPLTASLDTIWFISWTGQVASLIVVETLITRQNTILVVADNMAGVGQTVIVDLTQLAFLSGHTPTGAINAKGA